MTGLKAASARQGTFRYGAEQQESALRAFISRQRQTAGPSGPLSCLLGARTPGAEEIGAQLRFLDDGHDTPEAAFEAAFLRALLAGQDLPSAPSFEATFPETVDTQQGVLPALGVLQAEMRRRLYLPAHHHYPLLDLGEHLSPRRFTLHLTWSAEAGYGDHCAGYVQTSERPYETTDTCDGTRDDAALYLLRQATQQLGIGEAAFAGHSLAAYAHESQPQPFRPWLTWFSRAWREHEIGDEAPFTQERFSELLDSLYDMNHRSLSGHFEPFISRFPAE